ncbi:hypothetical protein L210DRAFT_3656892 [Boletus edulis BED1]|uniref:Uncharacterized protein n=1 Tax=Boletus edulis BED1 TaxID=1328754 RepID=A0AAD4G5Y2_BOLED|nr:hypothetical protein L210DRAFT_3656892 [Boletus edulis BED1]
MDQLLTETVLFYWDCFDLSIQAKNSIAGMGGTGDWADKLAAFKSSHPTQRSSSSKLNSRHARTVSSTSVATSLLTQDPQETSVSTGTRASSPTDRASSPTNHASSPTNETQLTLGPQDPYIQGSDECECKVMPNLPSKVVQATQHTNAMCVAEVVSDSEPGEWVTPPPIASDIKKTEAKGTKGKGCKKRAQQSNQASHQIILAMKILGSGINKKFVNNNLPLGATTDNTWRQLFISALAHFASGYDNPWAIPSDKFISVLQQIWNAVYEGKIKHVVTNNRPVYHIALNNWHSGFAAAAIAVITTFFANDADFTNSITHTQFAKAMLQKNRFLFSESRGTNKKAWLGLWRGLFMLQTFAHHFNFIQGRVRVVALDKELVGPCTVLALACAAVSRMLTLVANDNIMFKSDPGNSNGVWTAVIPNGSQYEFNETVWGPSMRRYLKPIQNLTEENFTLVIEETQKYLKKPALALNSVASDDEDSEFEDLFAFR